MIPLANGLEVCEDVVRANNECQLITPYLGVCSTYNYTIINSTNTIETGNLTLINESIYYLNFNQSRGDYIVVLCDDTTREIYVQEGDDQVWLAIIAGLFILIWILVKYSMELRDENTWLSGLKVGLAFIVYGLGLLVLNVSRLLAVSIGADQDIINMFNSAWTISIMITISISAFLLVWVCYRIIMVWVGVKKGVKE